MPIQIFSDFCQFNRKVGANLHALHGWHARRTEAGGCHRPGRSDATATQRSNMAKAACDTASPKRRKGGTAGKSEKSAGANARKKTPSPGSRARARLDDEASSSLVMEAPDEPRQVPKVPPRSIAAVLSQPSRSSVLGAWAALGGGNRAETPQQRCVSFRPLLALLVSCSQLVHR